jgi:hypothetical protein
MEVWRKYQLALCAIELCVVLSHSGPDLHRLKYIIHSQDVYTYCMNFSVELHALNGWIWAVASLTWAGVRTLVDKLYIFTQFYKILCTITRPINVGYIRK